MPLIVVLILFAWLPIVGLYYLLRGRLWRGYILRLAGLALLVALYAAPWLNTLAAARVWYYDPALTLGLAPAYAPVEEYLWLMLQAILTGLFVLWVWRRVYPGDFVG
jgi:lycopene cyclase domain-containing protein